MQVREEECDLAAEDVESIPYDQNYDSESSGTSSKPASSSSKESRQQNATAEANPSVKKISKEQNELKMKEVREFAANTATGQYHLNAHVLGLNYSSTFEEMIKGYRSMARRFHPGNNHGFDTT